MRLSTSFIMFCAALMAIPAQAGQLQDGNAASVPRPPSAEPYESAAFVPARVNEIEAMLFEQEEMEILAQEPSQTACEPPENEENRVCLEPLS